MSGPWSEAARAAQLVGGRHHSPQEVAQAIQAAQAAGLSPEAFSGVTRGPEGLALLFGDWTRGPFSRVQPPPPLGEHRLNIAAAPHLGDAEPRAPRFA